MQNHPDNPNTPQPPPYPDDPARGPGEHDQTEPAIPPESEPGRDYPAPNQPIEPPRPPMSLR